MAPDFIQQPLGSENKLPVSPAKPLPPPIIPPVITSMPQPPTPGFKGFYRANRIYFWAIFLGVIIIVVLAYFAFKRTPVATRGEANVSVTINSPETVASGGDIIYKILINNQDSVALTNVQLELVYPNGTTYESSVPDASNITGTLFDMKNGLPPGPTVTVIVKAKINGSINDVKQLTARLHYSYANFNSEFIKEQTFSVRLTASDVALEIDGPNSVNTQQLVSYTIKYANNSTVDISNAKIQVAYPAGFSFASSQPAADLSNNVWNISLLPAGQNGTINVQGTFGSANPGESKTLTAQFQILGQDGNFFTQSTADFATSIASSPLAVSQTLTNGNANNIADPGDQLTFDIKYSNNGQTALTGVNVIATLNSQALDLSSIRAQGANINNSVLTWNAASTKNLANLAPGTSGDLVFSVLIKNPATKTSATSLSFTSSLQIKANEYTTAFPGNQIALKISSPAAIYETLDYMSGPLPPKVGQTTLYRVTLNLKNSTNDFSNGVLTAFLANATNFVPGSVISAESANVTYDASTQKLTWNFNNLPAHAGSFAPARTLQFGINFTPSPALVNYSPALVKNVNFTATDNFTSQPVTVTGEDIATSNVSGSNNYNQGQVTQ